MFTLEELQSLGAIRDGLKVVSGAGCIPVSLAREMDDEAQGSFDGVIVIDSAQWVATVSAMPVSEARHVYSSNGKNVGIWDKKKRAFYTTQLSSDRLVTINSFNLKEGLKMAGKEIEINGDLMGDIMAEADAIVKENVGETKPITAFANQQVEAGEDDAARKKAKKEADIKYYDGIRAQFEGSSTASVKAPDEVILNNFKYGRLFAFITNSDPVVKVVAKTVYKTDLATKKKVLKASAPEDVKRAYNAGEKGISASYFEKEFALGLSQYKPGTAKGILVGTPVGTDLALTTIGNKSANNYDVTNTDLQFHVMSMDAAYPYLAYNYGDKIRESEDIPNAEMLKVEHAIKTDKENPSVVTIKSSLKVVDHAGKRGTLFTEGNYIPMRVFKTIDVGTADDKAKEVLNWNVEAVVAKKIAKGEVFTEDSQKLYTVNPDHSVSSAWVSGAVPMPEVTPYTKDETEIPVLRLPSRMRKDTKTPGEYTYAFEYYDIDDETGHGPLDNPAYAKIVEACGFTKANFIDLVKGLKAKKVAKSTKVDKSIGVEAYLKGCLGNDAACTSKSFLDIQSELDGLAM